jgi:energy-coupling factor transporter ATP-binding protein EcfA2
VIDGLIHESMTLLYGQTCSGKSTLASSLAIALATGQEKWLGRDIKANAPRKVGVIAGDPVGAREYARRIVPTIGSAAIDVYEPNRPTRPDTWERISEIADLSGWQFVILDNLSAFVPGSLSNDDDIRKLYTQIDNFPRQDIPVLLIAHSSDKSGEHGYSRIPMGSSMIRFGPRWWIYAYRSRGSLHLQCDGNEGTPHNIVVSEPDGTPHFEVLRTEDSEEIRGRARDRAAETKAKRADYRAFVLKECQGFSGTDTADALAAKFGGSRNTHAARLSDGGYSLERAEDGSWRSKLHVA